MWNADNFNCSAGHYCISGAVSPKPVGNDTGDICPKGAYCLGGSDTYIRCLPGTYSNVTGNEKESDCLNCTAGSYCSGYGNELPTGPCSPGYYCPEGQSEMNPSTFVCTVGHYCGAGSKVMTQCMPGHYQNEIGQDKCKVMFTSITIVTVDKRGSWRGSGVVRVPSVKLIMSVLLSVSFYILHSFPSRHLPAQI